MNRLNSTAVMARRHEPAASLDFFPTPPWATRALCQHVLPVVSPYRIEHLSAWEPACGEGHMAVALAESFALVHASDIFDYGYGQQSDFLASVVPYDADWIITNPPFNQGLAFALRAIEIAATGVALLVRTAFLEGEARHAKLFAKHPPAVIAQFSERVPMHRGRWVPDGSTATAYCWIVWTKRPSSILIDFGTRFVWIPKSRKTLTRPDDAVRFNAASPVPLLEGMA